MRTTPASLLVLVLLAVLSPPSFADESEVQSRIERILTEPDADLTVEVNALLALGPEKVRPVLDDLFPRLRDQCSAASGYRSEVESLAAILGGRDYEPPWWNLGTHYRVLRGHVVRSENHPEGGWSGNLHYNWTPSEGVEAHLGTGWREPLKPDPGGLLKLVLGPEPAADVAAQLGAHTLLNSAAAALGQAGRADPEFAKVLFEAYRRPDVKPRDAALLDGALRQLGGKIASELMIARLDRLILSADPHFEGWGWRLPEHIRAVAGEEPLRAMRVRYAKERPDVLAVFDEVVGGPSTDDQVLARARREPSAETLAALRARMDRMGAWRQTAPETRLAAMDLGLKIIEKGPEELHGAARSLLDAVLFRPADLRTGGEVDSTARRVLADIDDGRLLEGFEPKRSPFSDTVWCDEMNHGRDWALWVEETGAADPGYRPHLSFALWRDGDRLHLRVTNHGDRLVVWNRVALAYGAGTRIERERGEYYRLNLHEPPLFGRCRVPASVFDRIPPAGSTTVNWALPGDLPEHMELAVSFHDRYGVEGELEGIRLTGFEAEVATPFPDGGPLIVRVMDPGGVRVDDGEVSVYRLPVKWVPFLDHDARIVPRDDDPAPNATTSSGELGSCRFDHLETGRWRVVAEAPGRAPAEAHVVIAPGMPVSPVKLVLAEAASLAGRVLHEGEIPLPMVEVAATRVGTNTEPSSPTFDFRAWTDEQGRYRLSGLAPGDYALWTRRGGRVWVGGAILKIPTVVRVPDVSRYDIIVTDGAMIHGDVRGGVGVGGPVEGARVELLPDGFGKDPLDWTLTDEKGRYVLFTHRRHVNTDGLRVTATGFAEERVAPYRLRNLRQWEKFDYPLLTMLAPEARVSGTVSGPDGPVAGAQVRVWVRSEERFHRRFEQYKAVLVETRSDGSYSVGGLAAGKVAVQVVVDGFVHPGWEEGPVRPGALVDRRNLPAGRFRTVESGQKELCDVKMRADPARGAEFKVAGVVRDVAGRPLTLARVRVAGGPVTLTDVGGRFRAVGRSRPGAATFVNAGKRFFEREGTALDLADRRGWEDLEIRLRRRPVIRGLVTSSLGGSVAGARVNVCTRGKDRKDRPEPDWRYVPGTLVRPDGTFALPVPGIAFEDNFGEKEEKIFAVCVEADGHAPAFSAPFALAEGQDGASVEVALGSGHTLRGVLATQEGTPVSGAAIHLISAEWKLNEADWPPRYAPSRERVARAVSDVSGAFRVPDLVSGIYELRVEKPGMADTWATVRLPQAEEFRLVLRTLHPLAGVVFDPEGRPMPGTKIHLEDENGRVLDKPIEQTTDKVGRFRFHQIPAGNYRVLALPEVALGPVRTEPVPAGTTDLEIKLPRAHRIHGRLLGVRGGPLRNVTVTAIPVVRTLPWQSARTNRDGTFELWLLAPISYDVEFEGFGVTMRAVAAGTEIEYRVRGDLTISGKVVHSVEDENGPRSLTLLPLEPEPDPRIHRQHEADPEYDGSFEFKHLPPGRYRIVIREDHRERWRLAKEVTVTAGDRDIAVVIERLDRK